jgi:hypothetical protein
MAEVVAAAHPIRDVSPPPSSFEAEVVREFEPRAAEPAQPVPSGPGYAPAEPVKIEWPSDLVQIESDPEKVRPVEERGAGDQPVPRPKRVRQPAQVASEEPLVQIETSQADAGGQV